MSRVSQARATPSSAVTVKGSLGNTEFQALADWSLGDVRKVELTATVAYDDGSRLIAREEQVWEQDVSGEKSAVFHERDAAPHRLGTVELCRIAQPELFVARGVPPTDDGGAKE